MLSQVGLGRDLELSIALEDVHAPSLLCEYDAEKRSYALLLSFLPRVRASRLNAEIVVLVDRSGSMGGQPIQQARNTLAAIVDALPSGVFFNICGFGSRFEMLFPASVPRTVRQPPTWPVARSCPRSPRACRVFGARGSGCLCTEVRSRIQPKPAPRSGAMRGNRIDLEEIGGERVRNSTLATRIPTGSQPAGGEAAHRSHGGGPRRHGAARAAAVHLRRRAARELRAPDHGPCSPNMANIGPWGSARS